MLTRSVVIAAAILLQACDRQGTATRPAPSEATASPTTQRAFTTEEHRAVEIARRAVAANDDWVDLATFDPKREGDGWTVYVERLPRTPGGHRFVRIDAKGEVMEYVRGK